MNTKNLQKKIESKFGRPIRSLSDLKDLKEDVFKFTNYSIGFNTLRRFYSFLPTTKPSRSTLNYLSKYVGFENYSSFINGYKLDKIWYNWDKINNILLKNSLVEKDINWLVKKRKSEHYYMYLTYLMSSYIDRKNTKYLNTIFSNSQLFELDRKEFAKISTSISKKLKSLSKKKIEWITHLLNYESFRNLMLYSYVDVDTLNAYYGYLLKKSLPIINQKDEILFTKLMLGFYNFVRNKSVDITIASLEIPENCHPILFGRYHSMKLILEPKNSNENLDEFLKISKKLDSKIELFQEYIPILILIKEVEKIEQIFNTYYNELMDYEHWDHIHIERYNLIALSLVHIKNNELKLVPELFRYFDADSDFHVNDDYQKILYSISKYHYLQKLFGEGEKTSKVKRIYLKLVEKTGFTFFTESFLVNYFN
ncbi:MAG: hypothetical protein P8I02_06865 [Flavobacteriales bacterium]|nr:hypothetical protein [Flavobacteriales bacterium]